MLFCSVRNFHLLAQTRIQALGDFQLRVRPGFTIVEVGSFAVDRLYWAYLKASLSIATVCSMFSAPIATKIDNHGLIVAWR